MNPVKPVAQLPDDNLFLRSQDDSKIIVYAKPQHYDGSINLLNQFKEDQTLEESFPNSSLCAMKQVDMDLQVENFEY